MLKKYLILFVTTILIIGNLSNTHVVIAETPTEITPYSFSRVYGDAIKKMTYGNVFWGNMNRIPGWGTPIEIPGSGESVNSGYVDSQHRLSQFADINSVTGNLGLGGIRYNQLDVKMNDGSSVTMPYDGYYNSLDTNYYRAGKMFGTFLGVRQDYAVLPATPEKGLSEWFIVESGAYVATSLLFNSYTLNNSGGAYANMDKGWQFLSSSDGINWTLLAPSFRWENGTKGTGVLYNNSYFCFYSVTASMKLPAGHIYYGVKSPADVGLTGANPKDTFGMGATKISSTSMDNGAYGDEYVDVEILPSSVTPYVSVRAYGEASKTMFPGNVFWGDMNRVPGWGVPAEPVGSSYINTGYIDSQHRLSQYADITTTKGNLGMSGIRYTPLDVKMYDGAAVANPYEGYHYPPDPNFYRRGKLYGTFLGVRQDYAVFPAFPDKGLKETFVVKPGAYVATSLLFNSYTLIYSGVPYTTMDQDWQFMSSSDGVTWTAMSPNLRWENGARGSYIVYNNLYWCFYSVTASMKLPDGHKYYQVISPADSRLEGAVPTNTFAIGATKVSSTTMDNGLYGDKYVAWDSILDVNFSDFKVSNGNYITNISPGTTVSSVIKSLQPKNIFGTTISGGLLDNGIDKVTTGTRITVKINDVDTPYTVVVFGDVDGLPGIEIGDLATIKLHLLNQTLLSGDYFWAGDTMSRNRITVTDLLNVKKHIIGVAGINQNIEVKKN